jgi:hypothetical protein
MSTVKVNTVDKRTGGTLTLGGCGTTVTLGAGATQSGFGRTGTVDWCTTAKTAPFTGVSGNGYFVNTTSGVVTVTLPATPSAGDIISIADYASTFQTNNLTICRNSSKINGVCGNSILNTEGQSITLVYVDGTRGWKNTMDSTSDITGAPNFIVASGGTETNSPCGNFKIHTFTSDGFFAVTNAGTPAGSTNVDYLVVAGGGAGGSNIGGGGGAGGFRESYNPCTSGSYSASPLANPTSLPVSVQSYPIIVGGGGSATPGPGPQPAGGSGSNSTFSTITSAGGGGGGNPQNASATAGGSGGGGRSNDPASANPVAGGAGNTPPVSPPQGNTGGTGDTAARAGGGGGATAVGCNGAGSCSGDGGTGATTSISTSPTAYAGGGGGGGFTCYSTAGTGGTGGGGNGGQGPASPTGSNGTANTGGGSGGGGAASGPAGTGGPGIVIIRYKYQ